MHSCEKFKISLLFDLRRISSELDVGWMFVVFIHFKSQFCVLIIKACRTKTQNVSNDCFAIAVGCQLCDIAPRTKNIVVSSLIKKKSPLLAYFSFFCYCCCYVVPLDITNHFNCVFWLSATLFPIIHWENNLHFIWKL